MGCGHPVLRVGRWGPLPLLGQREAVALTSISMSHLSLKYYTVPVSAPHDPTCDTVQMAFMPTATQVPGPRTS